MIILLFLFISLNSQVTPYTEMARAEAICDQAMISVRIDQLDRPAEHECSEWLLRLNADLDCTPELDCKVVKK